MLKINKKFIFLFFTVLFTISYLLIANLIVDNETVDLDYKSFSDSDLIPFITGIAKYSS